MPRKMPPGLMTLLARSDAQIEDQTTLHISINNGDIVRDYYFASAELVISGVEYQPQLRQDDRIKSSLTRAADNTTVEWRIGGIGFADSYLP